MSLFELLKSSDSAKTATRVANEIPPSQEHIDGLKRFDDYNILKHFARTKIGLIYLSAISLAILGSLLVGMCLWMILLYFYNISSDTTEVKEFLESFISIILTVLSTLFLNYVLTRKRK